MACPYQRCQCPYTTPPPPTQAQALATHLDTHDANHAQTLWPTIAHHYVRVYTHADPTLPPAVLQAEQAEAEMDAQNLRENNITRTAKAVDKNAEIQDADAKSPTAVRSRRKSL